MTNMTNMTKVLQAPTRSDIAGFLHLLPTET